MTAVFVVLAATVVVVVAVVALRRADALLADRRPSALFEVDEAVEFVAQAVPDRVSARLSYDDVEALLGWHLVHLHGRRQRGEAPAVVDDEVVADLIARAHAEGREVDGEDVRAVLDAEIAYLRAIGALDLEERPET